LWGTPTLMSSSIRSERESGVGVGGLVGDSDALALGDGVVDRDEPGGDRLALRARFLGGEAEEEVGRSCFF
jgi:hypothetical protein